MSEVRISKHDFENDEFSFEIAIDNPYKAERDTTTSARRTRVWINESEARSIYDRLHEWFGKPDVDVDGLMDQIKNLEQSQIKYRNQYFELTRSIHSLVSGCDKEVGLRV